MPLISLDNLQAYALHKDLELRLVPDGDRSKIETREGSWHGRVSRWLKIENGEDRTGKRTEYGGAHNEIFNSLKEIYGDEIARKAFRASGFGRENEYGKWETNRDHPLTGRHIAKMLKVAECEMQRNSELGPWISGLRRGDTDGTPRVLLGEKISVPSGRMPLDEAFQDIGAQLDQDWQRLVDGKAPDGLWILDLGSRAGGRERVGLHCSANDPNVYSVFHRGNEYIVPKNDVAEWLQAFSLERFPNGLTDLSLCRGEEDRSGLLRQKAQENPDLQGVNDWSKLKLREKGGIPPWVDKVLDTLDESSGLLRSQTWTGGLKDVEERSERLQNHVEDLQERVNIQIGNINRFLGDAEVVVTHQLHLDEIDAVRREFAELLPQALPTDLGRGLPDDYKLRNQIAKAVFVELEAFMGQLRMERRSLTDDGAVGELMARLGVRLGEALRTTDLSEDERLNLFDKFMAALEDRLPGVVDDKLTPNRENLQRVESFCGELVDELQSQRTRLEALLQELEERPEVPPNDEQDLEERLELPPSEEERQQDLPPEGGVRPSVRVGFRRDEDLEDIAPSRLRFGRRGEEVVATVPNLLGFTPQRAMGKFGENHEKRLSQDKAGVPRSELERMPSEWLREHMDGNGSPAMVVRIGMDDSGSLDELLENFERLTDSNGDALNLTEEQRYGLTRFLDGRVFQDVYDQAVRRLLPSGTPTEVAQLDVLLQPRRGEDGRLTFDISFRAPLPDQGEDLKYRVHDESQYVEPGEEQPNIPVRTAETDDLVLSVTLHVQLEDLQKPRPKVRLDEPVIVFLDPPDDINV